MITVVFFIFVLVVLAVGAVIKEININEENKFFDKSDVKYTDGDNT